MEKVAIPLKLKNGQLVQGEADLFVNVSDREAKGIHMSRLYLALDKALENQVLSVPLIHQTLKTFIGTQDGLADSARLVLRWQEIHRRKALLSEFSGWKTYPVAVEAELLRGELNLVLKFSLDYSSACPCSAALARQLYQREFAKEFCEDNMSFEKVFRWLGESKIAVPHSQRSRADVSLSLKEGAEDIGFIKFINALEKSLKTPVQTAVKREDEQEFARLNGVNSMFVEDALRIMKKALETQAEIKAFEVKTHHFESLHAHDAVGSITSDPE